MSWNPKRVRARQRLDQKTEGLRPPSRFAVPAKGWIRAMRDSLGLSASQLARRLGIKSQSLEDMERNEAGGTIRLDSLRRAASALDCTLVYALVPNTSLQAMVDRQARQIALRAIGLVDHTMALEDQAVATPDHEAQIADYINLHVSEKDLWTDD